MSFVKLKMFVFDTSPACRSSLSLATWWLGNRRARSYQDLIFHTNEFFTETKTIKQTHVREKALSIHKLVTPHCACWFRNPTSPEMIIVNLDAHKMDLLWWGSKSFSFRIFCSNFILSSSNFTIHHITTRNKYCRSWRNGCYCCMVCFVFKKFWRSYFAYFLSW